MRPEVQARQILIDATLIGHLLADTLRNLDQATAGWPTTVPGASVGASNGPGECKAHDCTQNQPCPTHDPDGAIHLTAVERHATTRDPARAASEQLQRELNTATTIIGRIALICQHWGLTSVTDTKVKEGLAEKMREIWCVNHARAGLSETNQQGKADCRFCETIRHEGSCGVPNPNRLAAPKRLLEIAATRRLNSADFTRCMTDAYGPNWNKKVKGGKGRAA